MLFKHPKEKPFLGVAIAFILLGAFLASYGCVAWLYNYISETNTVAFPCFKFISGIMVIGFGYIIIELELMRGK